MPRVARVKPKILNSIPPRVRKILFWCAVAFVVYTLVGFFLLPPIIKWQMLKQLPAITKRRAEVQEVKVNPWELSLTVRGLSLTEPENRRFASWDELYVNLQASSLFRWAWTFKEIRLVRPYGELILLRDGQLNIANMLEMPTNAPPKPSRPPSIPRVNIFALQVTNGYVALEDRTRRSPFRTEYRPINLNLTQFTTRPNEDTPYSFHAESDAGRSVTWAGNLSIQPLASSGNLEVTGVKLSRYQPYLEDFTSALLTNGLADIQFTYRFGLDTNGLDLVVTNYSARVAEVQVLDPAAGETVASLRGLDIRGGEFDLRSRAARLGSVKVTEAALHTRLKQNGHLNLLDLVTVSNAGTNAGVPAIAASNKEPASLPLNVTVDDFTIEQTALSFEDRTRHTPFATELKPIAFSLKHFTTKPDSDASYSFRVASEAGETFEGDGTLSINPIRSSGELKASAVDLKKYLPYVEDFFRGRISSGKVESRVPYRFALSTNGIQAGVTNFSVKLTDLEVRFPESAETATRVAEIGFERVDASLEDRRGRVGLFKGKGGSVLARRQKDGSVNLLGLLAASRTNTPAAGAVSNQPGPASGATNSPGLALGGWTLKLDEMQLEDYTFKVEDLMLPKPAVFLLDQLALNLKGASTVSNTPVNANVSFRLNQTGTVAVRGTAKIMPMFADLEVAVTNVDLRAIQPYVEQFAALGIVSGELSTAGKVRFQTNDSAAPLLTFVGGVSVTNFATTDQVASKEFVRWDDLKVSGIEAALAPNHLKIDELRLVHPKASLIIGPDRQPNLMLILKKDSAATNSTTATTPSDASPSTPVGGIDTNSIATLFPAQLGALVLDQASVVFADESVQPSAAFGIEEISGTVKGLSTEAKSPAEVDLHGRMDAQSPFSVAGQVNLLATEQFVDLTITNANTQLTSLTGYLEKYGGYPLKKGRVSTSLHYHLEGKELQAQNKIQVDQLTLGARNNSPDATSLPLKLGVALLKDSDGRIVLDVPVTGRVDDPKFSIGPIVLRVIVNIIEKAAASPFKLLGSLVGGGGDELGYIEFKPGATNLVENETEKLNKLTTALVKRPSLNLEIEAAIDPVRDRDALAHEKLSDQLKARWLRELSAKKGAPTIAETNQFEPGVRERLLRTAFVEQFGTNISAILQTNTALLASTNLPAVPASAGAIYKPKGSLEASGSKKRKPPGEEHLTQADMAALGLATPELMETLLLGKVTVANEEFQQLMTARAHWVQDWFLQKGQIAPDRLSIAPPKPVDAAYRGESRVNLSVN
jgi:hypothetical protein